MTITKGNKAVVINGNEGAYWANVYVNVREGIRYADITGVQWKGKTLAGAKRWANRQLER
ncbi:MAG: hypothetical protein AAF903_12180 [Pseudomonadota bacterium]